jgi:hypothetical protein
MQNMGRAVWKAILLLIVLLALNCGNDGKTTPEDDGEVPTGWFSCAYGRGGALGPNECRGDYEIYAYRVSMDWWTEVPDAVDSVIFWIPSNSAIWTESLECISDGFVYQEAAGTKNNGHWKLNDPVYGYRSRQPLLNLWLSLEFVPDSLAKARVFFGNAVDSLYEIHPAAE